MAAISAGEEEIATHLFRKAANVNMRNKAGENALILAAKVNMPGIFEEVIRFTGSNVRDNDGNNALHHSAMSDCLRCAELLLSTPINVSSINKKGDTALDLATSDKMRSLIRSRGP